MSKIYDAVIIGAGHNGLACAAHLAVCGWQVAVFEQSESPGGAVKTLELTSPGFRHDWGAMNLSLFAASAFHQDYAARLADHGLEFVVAPDCFASVFPDGKWIGIGTDLEANIDRIAAFSGHDASVWRKLSDEFADRSVQIFELLRTPMTTGSLARFAIGSLQEQGIGKSIELFRFVRMSSRKWLAKTFESEHFRSSLAVWGMHLDFAPDIPGGALFPYLEGFANQSFGMVLGKGGSDTMIRAMTALIKEAGGEVICGSRVDSISRKGNVANGIVLANGEQFQARKAVVACTAPQNFLSQLLKGTSGHAAFDRKMSSFKHAPGTLMIHLALEDAIEWAAGPELSKFAYVHIAPSMNYMAQTYSDAQAGRLTESPILVVGQPTAIDSSRAPEGQHVAWIQVRMVPAYATEDAAGSDVPAEPEDVATVMADRALEILERYAPGTLGQVVGKTVFGPADLEAANPNLVGGDQICGSHHLSQNHLFRPAFGYADGATPIHNLHMTGAAVWPGAGVGAGSGYRLGQLLAGQ